MATPAVRSYRAFVSRFMRRAGPRSLVEARRVMRMAAAAWRARRSNPRWKVEPDLFSSERPQIIDAPDPYTAAEQYARSRGLRRGQRVYINEKDRHGKWRTHATWTANPARKKKRRPTGGDWQPDLFGGAGIERREGATRAEQMQLAAEEMRATGSRDLFDLEAERNPWGVPSGGLRTFTESYPWGGKLSYTTSRRLAALDEQAARLRERANDRSLSPAQFRGAMRAYNRVIRKRQALAMRYRGFDIGGRPLNPYVPPAERCPASFTRSPDQLHFGGRTFACPRCGARLRSQIDGAVNYMVIPSHRPGQGLRTRNPDDWAPADLDRYDLVRTRSGSEIHLGVPGRSTVAGHQLGSARSVTFKAHGARDVTCERCRGSSTYRAWARRRNPASSNPRAKYRAWCGRCYSMGPPLETPSIRAAERWAVSHMHANRGHDTHITRLNPASSRNGPEYGRSASAFTRAPGVGVRRDSPERRYVNALTHGEAASVARRAAATPGHAVGRLTVRCPGCDGALRLPNPPPPSVTCAGCGVESLVRRP